MSASPCSDNSNESSLRCDRTLDSEKSASSSTKLEIDLSVNNKEEAADKQTRSEFGCGICEVKFASFESLDEHYVESHNCRVEHICPKCNSGYHIIQDYYQHKSSHVEAKQVKVKVEGEKKEDEEERGEEKKDIVDETEEAPKKSKAKKRKSEISLSLFKKPKKEKLAKVEPVEDLTGFEEKTYDCPQCTEKNISCKDFVEHCKSSHNRTPCLKCGQTFAQKSFLERHSWKHAGVKPFPCDECPKAFTRKHALDNHKIKNHATVKVEHENKSNSELEIEHKSKSEPENEHQSEPEEE